MPEFTRFEVVRHDNVTVLRLTDSELSDLLIQDAFYEEIMAVLSSDVPHNLVINFAVVKYCTTGIINALISAKKRVVEKQGEIRFCELNQHVRGAFRALNLEGTVFPVCESEAEAVAAFDK